MRVVFMGTSAFSVPSLKELIARNFDIIGVVTQPNRPSGRGNKVAPPPVMAAATHHDLQIYQPQKISRPDFVRTLTRLQPDVIVVVAFGQIIPKSVLDLPPCGCINVHPSLLPKYRGAAPIQWALINGETETGITIMLLDESEDTGDIILQQRMKIGHTETASMLSDRLAHAAPAVLVEALENTPANAPPPHIAQNHEEATHAHRLTKETGEINWAASARQIFNLVRGTANWPGAYSFVADDLRLKILECHVVDDSQGDDLPPGMVAITAQRKLIVGTGEGGLHLDYVQPANKKKMNAYDFLNGYHLKTGDRFLPKSPNQ